jgi:hypothetical protein
MLVDCKKRCPRCQNFKASSEYYKSKHCSDRLSSYCKKCSLSYVKHWRHNKDASPRPLLTAKEKAEHRRVYGRRYYAANREKILSYAKDYHQTHKEEYGRWVRANRDKLNTWKRKDRQARPDYYNAIKARHRARHKDRQLARQWLYNELRTGRLTPKPCEICNTTERLEGHHPDYSRPKYVRWLCFDHHRAVENGKINLSEPAKQIEISQC